MAQAHLDAGFFIAAHSTAGSKFKLLLFEQSAEGQWELLMQARTQFMLGSIVFCACWGACLGHMAFLLGVLDCKKSLASFLHMISSLGAPKSVSL